MNISKMIQSILGTYDQTRDSSTHVGGRDMARHDAVAKMKALGINEKDARLYVAGRDAMKPRRK